MSMRLRMGPRPIGTWPIGAILAAPLLLLPLGGWLVESDSMILARCTFKSMLGIPCMGCGATRATLNFMHGDLIEALTFSPMIAPLYVALALWGLLSAGLFLTGRRLEVEMTTWTTWAVRGVLISIPFMNWFYVMAHDV